MISMKKVNYAAIDIGSNAVRLLIKCVNEENAPELMSKNLQCLTDILVVHPLTHTPASPLAIDAIHSLNELPKARHKLLKGLFLNTDNLHNYFIFTLNIRLFHEPTFARQSK